MADKKKDRAFEKMVDGGKAKASQLKLRSQRQVASSARVENAHDFDDAIKKFWENRLSDKTQNDVGDERSFFGGRRVTKDKDKVVRKERTWRGNNKHAFELNADNKLQLAQTVQKTRFRSKKEVSNYKDGKLNTVLRESGKKQEFYKVDDSGDLRRTITSEQRSFGRHKRTEYYETDENGKQSLVRTRGRRKIDAAGSIDVADKPDYTKKYDVRADGSLALVYDKRALSTREIERVDGDRDRIHDVKVKRPGLRTNKVRVYRDAEGNEITRLNRKKDGIFSTKKYDPNEDGSLKSKSASYLGGLYKKKVAYVGNVKYKQTRILGLSGSKREAQSDNDRRRQEQRRKSLAAKLSPKENVSGTLSSAETSNLTAPRTSQVLSDSARDMPLPVKGPTVDTDLSRTSHTPESSRSDALNRPEGRGHNSQPGSLAGDVPPPPPPKDDVGSLAARKAPRLLKERPFLDVPARPGSDTPVSRFSQDSVDSSQIRTTVQPRTPIHKLGASSGSDAASSRRMSQNGVSSVSPVTRLDADLKLSQTRVHLTKVVPGVDPRGQTGLIENAGTERSSNPVADRGYDKRGRGRESHGNEL
jgi:hypothetical protein